MTPDVAAQPLELPGHAHVYSGKVRDLYAPLDPATGRPREDQLLLVASDRISAFDHILDSEIPDKGKVLTQLSLWWFEQLADILPNHVISSDVPDAVAGRAVLVRRLDMLPVECIGRAYLTGSGLADYRASGSVCGVPLPAGLRGRVGAARADLHPDHQGAAGRARPADDLRAGRGRRSAPTWPPACAS